MKEPRFNEVFEEIKLNPEFKEPMLKMHEANKEALKSFIEDKMDYSEVHFKELHWRIDMQIADKIKGNALIPKFLLNLTLNEKGKEKSMLIESNYSNLARMRDELKNAVAAINLSYGRKVIKYAK